MNTRFEYLYRDGSNYKRWGAVVFSGIATVTMKSRLMTALESSQLFIAHQVRVPELFFAGSIDADDHCFHEFADVVQCNEPADDAHGRTFEEFVSELERAVRDGWDVFDPAERALSPAWQA